MCTKFPFGIDSSCESSQMSDLENLFFFIAKNYDDDDDDYDNNNNDEIIHDSSARSNTYSGIGKGKKYALSHHTMTNIVG